MRKFLFIASLLLLAAANNVHGAAASFDIFLTGTSYAVDGDDTYIDLLQAHQAGIPQVQTQLVGLENQDSFFYTGQWYNYSMLLTTTLDIGKPGNYTFQFGGDWGRGGGVALLDADGTSVLDEVVRTDDIWWANDWNNSDVITTTYALSAQQYTISWLGFEGCCGGNNSVRFSFNGSAFQGLNLTTIAPYVVPIPSAVWLLGSCAVGLLAAGRRRRVGEPSGSEQAPA